MYNLKIFENIKGQKKNQTKEQRIKTKESNVSKQKNHRMQNPTKSFKSRDIYVLQSSATLGQFLAKDTTFFEKPFILKSKNGLINSLSTLEKWKYVQYQNFAELNGGFSIAGFLALTTPTKDTNPLEF